MTTYSGPVPLNLHVKCDGAEVSIERSETYDSCSGYVSNVRMSDRQELLFYHLPAGEYQVIVIAAATVPNSGRKANDLKISNFNVSLALDDDIQTSTGTIMNVRGDSRQVFAFVVSNR